MHLGRLAVGGRQPDDGEAPDERVGEEQDEQEAGHELEDAGRGLGSPTA